MKNLGEIRLFGDIFSLPVVLEFVSTHAKGCGLCKERAGEVLRAVEEAVSNIIDEGYGNAYGEVEFACRQDSMGRLIITIADSAPPFDILEMTGAVVEPGGIAGGVSGRFSTAIMCEMINHIGYERRGDKNVLVFTIEEVA
jgi:anti-sigma regulatory factor (Ser/Thr protein kinase)